MGKTIMTVDDSASVRQMVSFTLRDAGFEVIEAVDGRDAMKKLGATPVHMMITDLNMPNMDGISFVKNLRSGYYNPDLPVVMLTTTRDGDLKEEALGAGVNMFLTKPIQPEVLIYKIESLLAGGS